LQFATSVWQNQLISRGGPASPARTRGGTARTPEHEAELEEAHFLLLVGATLEEDATTRTPEQCDFDGGALFAGHASLLSADTSLSDSGCNHDALGTQSGGHSTSEPLGESWHARRVCGAMLSRAIAKGTLEDAKDILTRATACEHTFPQRCAVDGIAMWEVPICVQPRTSRHKHLIRTPEPTDKQSKAPERQNPLRRGDLTSHSQSPRRRWHAPPLSLESGRPQCPLSLFF